MPRRHRRAQHRRYKVKLVSLAISAGTVRACVSMGIDINLRDPIKRPAPARRASAGRRPPYNLCLPFRSARAPSALFQIRFPRRKISLFTGYRAG